jgi:hypothetical protein
MNEKRMMLCHFLASIATRTQKALRVAPREFATFRIAPGSRTPHEIVQHMESVLGYARTFLIGGAYRNEPMPSLHEELLRLHETLDDLAALIGNDNDFIGITAEQLLQGPFSDAMTHAGQLAFLNKIHGSPVPSENFIYARINPDNLTIDQPFPERPDLDWKP